MLLGPLNETRQTAQVPVFAQAIPAGFPSPADDFLEGTLDFNELLIKKPAATYCLRVSGHSMVGAGIHHRDYVIVDRSQKPEHDRVVVVAINGDFTLKRLILKGEQCFLASENQGFPLIPIQNDQELQIFGCATYVIHPL